MEYLLVMYQHDQGNKTNTLEVFQAICLGFNRSFYGRRAQLLPAEARLSRVDQV